jgi:hypothetical protein
MGKVLRSGEKRTFRRAIGRFYQVGVQSEKLEMAAVTVLNCQRVRPENVRLCISWRRERNWGRTFSTQYSSEFWRTWFLVKAGPRPALVDLRRPSPRAACHNPFSVKRQRRNAGHRRPILAHQPG